MPIHARPRDAFLQGERTEFYTKPWISDVRNTNSNRAARSCSYLQKKSLASWGSHEAVKPCVPRAEKLHKVKRESVDYGKQIFGRAVRRIVSPRSTRRIHVIRRDKGARESPYYSGLSGTGLMRRTAQLVSDRDWCAQ